MLHHLDAALESYLRVQAPLPRSVRFTVDPSLEADEPTVLLNLRTVARSATSVAGTEVIERGGQKLRRNKLPRIEVNYDLSARANTPSDAHELLGRLLLAVLRSPTIPLEHLPEAIRSEGLPTVSLRRDDRTERRGGEAHDDTVLSIVVSMPVEIGAGQLLSDAPSETAFGVGDTQSGARSNRRIVAGRCALPEAVGADVVCRTGHAVVAADGTFAINAVPGDEVTVLVEPPLVATVPDQGPIVVG